MLVNSVAADIRRGFLSQWYQYMHDHHASHGKWYLGRSVRNYRLQNFKHFIRRQLIELLNILDLCLSSSASSVMIPILVFLKRNRNSSLGLSMIDGKSNGSICKMESSDLRNLQFCTFKNPSPGCAAAASILFSAGHDMVVSPFRSELSINCVPCNTRLTCPDRHWLWFGQTRDSTLAYWSFKSFTACCLRAVELWKRIP